MTGHRQIVAFGPRTTVRGVTNCTSMPKRRWTVPVRDLQGRRKTIEIRTPMKQPGEVLAWMDSTGVRLDPQAAGQLSDAYRAAQLRALQDKGEW
jgi:hypothetical protein